MSTAQGVDLAAAQERLPPGLRVRAGTTEDLERLVEFQNRYARPAFRTDVAMERRFEEGNPQPDRLTIVVEEDAGSIVATGFASDGGMFAAPDRSWRLHVRVAPEERRRGIGSAILERLVAHAREKGAAKLKVSIRGDEPEGVPFAERHGFVEYHRRIDAYVDVRTFDASRFEAPQEIADRAGVRLLTWTELRAEAVGDLEPWERRTYAMINEATKDIPRPDPLPEPPPFEAVRKVYFDPPAFDTDATVVAIQGDQPAGITLSSPPSEGVAYTYFTGVARPFRGRGLALALKLRALAALKAKGATLFGTTNDPANAPMRGINAKLGYVPEPPSVQLERSLA